jgi:hypothetical protein
MILVLGGRSMESYYAVPGVDTGVRCTANSGDVLGNVRVRLAVGGEAGIVVEESAPDGVPPDFVAIYFACADLPTLIRHLRAMQREYEADGNAAAND